MEGILDGKNTGRKYTRAHPCGIKIGKMSLVYLEESM